MNERLYSMQEIAGIMGCSYKTVQRLIKSGKLGYVPVGRLIRITLEDLEEYKRSQKENLQKKFIKTKDKEVIKNDG